MAKITKRKALFIGPAVVIFVAIIMVFYAVFLMPRPEERRLERITRRTIRVAGRCEDPAGQLRLVAMALVAEAERLGSV